MFITAAALAVLLIECLRRGAFRGRFAFLAVLFGLLVWTILKGLELLSEDPQSKLMLMKFQYTAIALLPPAILIYVIQYTGLYRSVRWGDIGLLIMLPVFNIGLVATNAYHHIFWRDVWVEGGAIPNLDFDPGPFFFVHAAFSYLLVLISIVLLLMIAFQHRRHRMQCAILIAAVTVPVVGGVVYEAVLGGTEVDMTTILFPFSAVLLVLGVFRFDLLSRYPLTRNIIFDSIEDPILTLDARGSVTDMNRAAELLTGHDKESASHLPLKDLLPLTEPMAKDLLHGVSRSLELKDSQGRRILAQSFDLGRDGRLLIIRDITKLKEAELVLKRSHEEMEKLVDLRTRELRATADTLRKEAEERAIAEKRSHDEASRSTLLLDLMGHDIGNLNQAIYGRVQLMKEKEEDHAWLKRQIASLDESMRKALTLIEDIRTMSVLERSSPEPKPLDVSAMVRRCARSAQDAFPGRSVTLHTEGIRNDVLALGEPVVERAIYNVIHNAIKVQREDPVVWIWVRAEGAKAVISVADAGPGIPPEARGRLMERKERSGEVNLSGVGLMFSRTAVERLGGRILIGDRVEGDWTKGAKFTIELRLHK
jgi:signal transduction histidine kinase